MTARRFLALLARGLERVAVLSVRRPEGGDLPRLTEFDGATYRRTSERTRGGYPVFQQETKP